jgi:hypothetical protein
MIDAECCYNQNGGVVTNEAPKAGISLWMGAIGATALFFYVYYLFKMRGALKYPNRRNRLKYLNIRKR